jgi:hypothetical protein
MKKSSKKKSQSQPQSGKQRGPKPINTHQAQRVYEAYRALSERHGGDPSDDELREEIARGRRQ